MRTTKTNDLKKNYWENFSDEAAAEYMEAYGEGPGSPLRMFISSLINDGETVLDVGCGPGWNLDHFTKYGPNIKAYRGLDFSAKFVKIANQRWKDKRSFAIGDVRNFHEASQSWDVVLMQDVLEHTNGYEKPLKEALRVARKRIIITFWHLKDEDDPHINDDGSDTWGAWYDKREWEKHLDGLGLHWLHDEVIRGENLVWHVYVIDEEINGTLSIGKDK